MADQIIRPINLPPRASPVASEVLASDNGSVVGGITLEAAVNAGRPVASQAEAEAGVEATKAMTPLTTAQAIAAQGDVRFASAAQGALASTAVQPGDLATVATSGAYADLSGKPTLGTAAAQNTTAFATAAQGAKADTAVQGVVAGANVTVDNTDPLHPIIAASAGSTALPKGSLYGLLLSNNAIDATNDIDIAVGSCRDISNTYDMVVASTLTKRLDANWAVGTNQGGLDTGSKVANAWYYVHLIRRASDGLIDGLFSGSRSSPSLPGGWTAFRCLGAILTSATSVILPFLQTGDYFGFKTPVTPFAAGSPAIGATLKTLVGIPLGKKYKARIFIFWKQPTTGGYYGVKDPDQGVPTNADAWDYLEPSATVYGRFVAEILTNTSAQMYVWSQRADSEILDAKLQGFYDDRERGL